MAEDVVQQHIWYNTSRKVNIAGLSAGLQEAGIVGSIGSSATPSTGLMESAIGLCKTELIGPLPNAERVGRTRTRIGYVVH